MHLNTLSSIVLKYIYELYSLDIGEPVLHANPVPDIFTMAINLTIKKNRKIFHWASNDKKLPQETNMADSRNTSYIKFSLKSGQFPTK